MSSVCAIYRGLTSEFDFDADPWTAAVTPWAEWRSLLTSEIKRDRDRESEVGRAPPSLQVELYLFLVSMENYWLWGVKNGKKC